MYIYKYSFIHIYHIYYIILYIAIIKIIHCHLLITYGQFLQSYCTLLYLQRIRRYSIHITCVHIRLQSFCGLLAAILPERSLASGNLKLFRRPTSEPEIKMQIGFRWNHSNLGKWLWKNMASNSTTPQAPLERRKLLSLHSTNCCVFRSEM